MIKTVTSELSSKHQQSEADRIIMTQSSIENGNDCKETAKINDQPKSLKFILCNIFFERYSTGGILAILALFLNRKLGFDPNVSTALYHTYEFFIYFFTIFGAIIADSWLGLFKTITAMSLVYSFGSSLIAFSGIESIASPTKLLSVMGLVLTVIGSGSLKSNLNTFGGNQFKLPEQSAQLSSFFSVQYFAVKCGSTVARATFPILREDVKCFGMDDCYPLSFSLPAIAMLISAFVLVWGRKSYAEEAPNGNMFIKSFGCIMTGIKQKFVRRNLDSKGHWLDFAEEKHGTRLVSDTKMVLNVLVIYIPLPLFWALHSQQGSRWVFQASKMNGDIGFYIIKPDQMIVLNSLLGIFLIPVFEKVLYPLLSRMGIRTLLQKMVLGGIMTSFAFVLAALVEIQIENSFISILWMFPQYLIMVMGEILIYTANLNFSYTEAPASMKSVMVAFMYLAEAGGCLIVIAISGIAFFDTQAYEFLFFAGLVFVDAIALGFLATRYKYVNQGKTNVPS